MCIRDSYSTTMSLYIDSRLHSGSGSCDDGSFSALDGSTVDSDWATDMGFDIGDEELGSWTDCGESLTGVSARRRLEPDARRLEEDSYDSCYDNFTNTTAIHFNQNMNEDDLYEFAESYLEDDAMELPPAELLAIIEYEIREMLNLSLIHI